MFTRQISAATRLGWLLAGSLFLAVCTPAVALAQDATWLASPVNNDWTNTSNWSTGSVPTGTATFGATSQPSISLLDLLSPASLGTLLFTPAAPQYTFTLDFSTMALTGSGIVNQSLFAPHISVTNPSCSCGAFLNFYNSASAGNAVITQETGSLSSVQFFDSSSAGTATLNLSSDSLTFAGSSTGDHATIVNGSRAAFLESSNAGDATITTLDGGQLTFGYTASAGNATITTENGGVLQFFDTSSGGTARIITDAGGLFDLSSYGSSSLSVGSIEGDGTIDLGSVQLTVGTNNLSTVVGGTITDTGSLVKVGTGTLTLTGANDYTGGTTVSGGTLAGTTTSLQVDIVDNATVEFDQGFDGTYAGTMSGTGALTKSGTGALTLTGAFSYTGATTVSGGTLRAGAANEFASTSATTVGSGATLDLNGFDQTIGSLAGAGTVALGSANLTAGGDNTSTTFSGAVTGTGGLTKTGTGTLTLTGANTYSGGTTVSAGTLAGTTTGLQGAIVDNAAVQFNQDFDGTYGGAISGTGTLTKAGTGTLTLAGANDYTGGTTVSGGALAGTTTSLQGDIADNATVEFDQNFDGTYAGAVSGTGALTKSGTGALTLTGAFSYTGATTVNGGTLRAGAANEFASTSATTVGSGATLDLNGFDQTIGSLAGAGTVALGSANLTAGGDNTSTTLSGAITGTGALMKSGTGTLTLTGTSTYTGGTTVSSGTLQGDATSLQGDIADNAALVFDQSGTGTYAGVISGTGTVTKSGAGTLTLSGVDTYRGGTTVSGGTLQGDATSLQGDIADDAALVFDQSGTGTYAGVISGAGAVTKTGSGTLTLTGTSTYSGGTTVSAGTLQGGAAGVFSAASAFIVAAGATLDIGEFDQTVGSLAGAGTVQDGDTTVHTLTAGGDNSSTTFGGSLIDGSGILAFAKTGTGTLTLTGTSTYSGGTTLAGGIVHISSDTNVGGGTITFEGGELQFGAPMTVSQAIVDDSGAKFDTEGYDVTFDNAMTGAGSLTKFGSGTLTLTGTNTYSGGTTLVGGLVNISSAANLGSGTITFAGGGIQFGAPVALSQAIVSQSGGTLDTNGFDIALGIPISGAGGLTKTGAGTLTLTGTNTYTGGTTVDGGTLQLGNGGSLAASGPLAVNGGTFDLNGHTQTVGGLAGTGGAVALGGGALTVNEGGSDSYAGTISGAGSLTKTGSGTLALTGTNTFTGDLAVEGGTLNVTSDAGFGASSNGVTLDGGTLQFGGAFNTDRTFLVGSGDGAIDTQAFDVTFGGTVDGAGTLLKTGAGTLTLAGTDTLSGTVVEQGTLALDGTLTSDVAVGPAGIFAGSGTLHGSLVDEGTLAPGGASGTAGAAATGSGQVKALLQPGATVGTAGAGESIAALATTGGVQAVPADPSASLAIGGDLTLGADSGYDLAWTADGLTQTVVTGTAALDGTLTLQASAPLARATTFDLLQAGGGISGTFTDVVADPASGTLQSWFIEVDHHLLLTVIRTDVPLASLATTANGAAAGAALDRLRPTGDLTFQEDVREIAASPDAGAAQALDEIGGETYASLARVSLEQSRSWLDRLQAREAGSVATEPGAGGGPSVLTFAAPHGWWVQAIGTGASLDATAVAHGASYQLQGGEGGYTFALGGRWSLGLAGSYGRGTFDLHTLGDTTTLAMTHADAALSYRAGRLAVTAVAGGGYDRYDVARPLVFAAPLDPAFGLGTGLLFGGVDRRVTSQPHATAIHTGLQARYAMRVGRFDLVPVAGFGYLRWARAAVSEANGGPLGLAIAAGATDSADGTVGATLSRRVQPSGRWWLAPRVHVAYTRQLAATATTAAAEIGGSTAGAFVTQGLALARNTVTADAGVDFPLWARVVASVEYHAALLDGERAQTVVLGVGF